MLGAPLSGCSVIVCGLMFCVVVDVSGVTPLRASSRMSLSWLFVARAGVPAESRSVQRRYPWVDSLSFLDVSQSVKWSSYEEEESYTSILDSLTAC